MFSVFNVTAPTKIYTYLHSLSLHDALPIFIFSVFLAHLIHWNGDGLDLHWAYLIVFVFYLILAGLLAFIGLKKVKQVKGPEKAIHQDRKSTRLNSSH